MAKKSKIREIDIVEESGAFNTFFKKVTGDHKDFDYDSLALLRRLLSNEKARLLNTIKKKNPKSIYELAKLLGRDFKAVMDDIQLLERFGFVELEAEKSGKRERLKPVLATNQVQININI